MEKQVQVTNGTSDVLVASKPKVVRPFPVRFAEIQNEVLLRKGLEEYDDPTTVDTTNGNEDPKTDSD